MKPLICIIDRRSHTLHMFSGRVVLVAVQPNGCLNWHDIHRLVSSLCILSSWYLEIVVK